MPTGRPYVEIGLVPQPMPGPKVLRCETDVNDRKDFLSGEARFLHLTEVPVMITRVKPVPEVLRRPKRETLSPSYRGDLTNWAPQTWKKSL